MEKKSTILISIVLLVISIFLSGCVTLENQPANLADGNSATVDEFGNYVNNQGCGEGRADRDGDGFCDGITQDCDDTDTNIYPSAVEKCDGIDNDCDGKIDEGCEAECMDECVPEGSTCYGTALKKCMNIDQDPCTELIVVDCTFGCANQDKCRAIRLDGPPADTVFMRSGDRAPASEAWEDYAGQDLADEACTGELIHSVYWTEYGALCKQEMDDEAYRGYLTPLSCCRRTGLNPKCAIDMGIAPGQYDPLPNKYHLIECYSEKLE